MEARFNLFTWFIHLTLIGIQYRKTKNYIKISEYDQEIPQSQTTDKPIAPRGRVTQQLRDTRKTNKVKQSALSSHQDDFKTRMDIK